MFSDKIVEATTKFSDTLRSMVVTHNTSSVNDADLLIADKTPCISDFHMLPVIDVGERRELEAILSLYLTTLLLGCSNGFSAVAVPGIKEEMRYLVIDS